MNEYTNRELGIMLKALTKNVQEGFSGIHERQDKSNHGISNNKDRLSSLECWKNKVLGALVITQVMLVPLAIAALINHLG